MKANVFCGLGPLGYIVLPAVASASPAQQRKKQFIDEGHAVKQWARMHGFADDMPAVYRVLNGQSPALRGKAHQIAVALGIKPSHEPIQEQA